MPSPRVLILRAPGTNCDEETAFAFDRAGAVAQRVHINRLLENRGLPAEYQILCLPGGFSYGDDLAAGRILASQIRHHLAEVLAQFKDSGKLILGICNGFQVLIQSALLLSQDEAGPRASLTWNDSGRFEDRWVHLRVDGDRGVFLRGLERLYLPVAHAEGQFVTRNEETLHGLNDAGQLVLRYCGANGGVDDVDYPANPNGSQANVAGICDDTGRVLGMMPHPERYIDPVQHPRWTRGDAAEVGDGFHLFRNAVSYYA